MIFLIKKDFFLKVLRIAAFIAVEKKIGANIFGSHVLLKVVSNKLSLIVTDLDIELILEEIIDSVEEDGAVVVPFRKIIEICRAMTVDVVLKVFTNKPSSKLHIESNQGFFSINYHPAEEFPQLSAKSFYTSFVVEANTIANLISKTSFAMGDDDNRQFLNGVFLKFAKDNIISVATDGHRLAVWEVTDCILDLSSEVKILLPRKSVFDLLKVLNESYAGCAANVSVGENHVRIVLGNITFTSKLLAAVFPAYQKLIPIKLQNHLIANREILKACFLRAAALLGDKSQGVRLLLSKDTLEMTARNENEDLIKETILVNYSGEPLEICFNVKYLLDFLSNIDSEEVLLKMENSKSGVLFQDPRLKSSYVLMPMQL